MIKVHLTTFGTSFVNSAKLIKRWSS